jgi:hypothetical protein
VATEVALEVDLATLWLYSVSVGSIDVRPIDIRLSVMSSRNISRDGISFVGKVEDALIRHQLFLLFWLAVKGSFEALRLSAKFAVALSTAQHPA